MGEPIETPIFTEQQRFPLWLRLTVLVLMGAAVAALGLAMLSSQHPQSDPAAFWIIIPLGLIAPLAAAALIWFYRMDTRVCSDGLYVRCFPLHRRFRRFAPAEIAESRARTYRPLVEYGGWGIRGSLTGAGRAYNVSGNEGVQLIFTNGRKLLIGSRRPQQLEAALRSLAANR